MFLFAKSPCASRQLFLLVLCALIPGCGNTSLDVDAPLPAADEVVALSETQQQAAGIAVAPVGQTPLQERADVPGRLRYDETRHIEVRIPAAGVLTSVRVLPGTAVSAGQVLAEVQSDELGELRADVLHREADAEILQRKSAWERTRCDGVERLIQMVGQEVEAAEIARNLEGITLGDAREKITTAYLRYRLATNLATSVQGQGAAAVPAREVQQRVNEREAAQAALRSVLEQSLFEARQQRDEADHAAADALRRLEISRRQVRSILGLADDAQLLVPDQPLSLVEIRAPFAGTIESCHYARSERLPPQAALFVLADTSRLWVAAEVREREWAALSLQPGQPLSFALSSPGSTPLTAEVVYVGREVDPQSNAVPVFAAVDNSAGALRPGQYVTVRLPLGEAASRLAVPAAAVVEHEGSRFVFVEQSPRTYRRVNVLTGLADGDLIEILSGLREGDPVVVRGAFVLKSQLLLASEAE